MFSAAEAVAAPEMDYASLRADVVKAYAQQAAEMTQSLTVLQALSTDTAVMLTRLESACASNRSHSRVRYCMAAQAVAASTGWVADSFTGARRACRRLSRCSARHLTAVSTCRVS